MDDTTQNEDITMTIMIITIMQMVNIMMIGMMIGIMRTTTTATNLRAKLTITV